MECNPTSLHPDDPGGARQDFAPNHLPTMAEVAANIAERAKVNAPNTFMERVLLFLDQHAA